MTNTETTQATVTEPGNDALGWKDLLDDIEGAADRFTNAADDLTELLDQFNEDAPEDVCEAASDVSLEVCCAAIDVGRKLQTFHAAVADADANTNTNSQNVA